MTVMSKPCWRQESCNRLLQLQTSEAFSRVKSIFMFARTWRLNVNDY